MLQIQIPKDVRTFDPKIVGQFTTRQIFCLLGIIIIAMFTHWLGLGYYAGSPLFFVLFFIGWGDKIVGMPVDKYMRYVFISQMLYPKKRKYAIRSYYRKIESKYTPMYEHDLEMKHEKEAIMNGNNPKLKKKEKPKKKVKAAKRNLPYELTAFA